MARAYSPPSSARPQSRHCLTHEHTTLLPSLSPTSGLADAAKSVGTALRSFQPTIREVAQISTELKSTLEQEIGLDEIKKEIKGVNSSLQDLPRAFDEKVAAVADPSIEEMRRKSAEMAWSQPKQAEGTAAPTQNVPATLSADASPAAPAPAAPTAAPTASTKGLGEMSVEELEAELARRKAAKN